MTIDKNLTPKEQVNLWLHKIVDELHPLLVAISDEEFVEINDVFGIYTRDFLHKNGKKFRLTWRINYDEPNISIRTVFEPAIEL
jgi:hypothetical protein